MRVLVVNADDFGFTKDVNEGIVHAHQNGILTSTTMMANGTAFDHAVELARDTPTLDIGCHLVLVGGASVAEPGRPLPKTVGSMMAAVATGRLRVYEELEAQVRRILDAGVDPTHLDTHKHTHLFPPVLEAVARISVEFEIPWVRRPFDLPAGAEQAPALVRATSRSLSFLRRKFQAVLDRHGCLTTDHFAGFQMTGRFRAHELARLIAALPRGITEFMCHPGYCRGELRAAHTRLKESRAQELEALTDTSVKAAVQQAGVHLSNFQGLGTAA